MSDRDSSEPLFLYLGGTVLSVLLDIIFIAAAFHSPLAAAASSLCKFSAAMAIIFLISKPFQAVILYHMYKERGGDYGFNIGELDWPHDFLSASNPIEYPKTGVDMFKIITF